jgi:hypothetical protein
MAYDLWPFILSNVGRTRNLTIRAWPGDGRVLMGLWGLELLICACCVDGRDNVASDSQDEGIHGHIVSTLNAFSATRGSSSVPSIASWSH